MKFFSLIVLIVLLAAAGGLFYASTVDINVEQTEITVEIPLEKAE